jgi:hypothetical protein
MRYITRATLLARQQSNAWTTIFIPPGEVVDTQTDPENPVTVRLLWRGQRLRVAEPDLSRSTDLAEPALMP